jgi:glucan 1,3-beta-glucosidase
MAALHGVNLGGWLVLERWMTPGLFAGTSAVDEYTFMQTLGAAEKIDRHRRTFIDASDIAWLADHGVELIRVPVGYWVLEDDAPYVMAASHLDWLMDQAAARGIKVLICLHGAPGSQNGHDHSGRVGRAAWFDEAAYRERTTEVLARLAQHYAHHQALWGIELLNEPQVRLFHPKLRRFYRQARDRLETILPPHVTIVFHDAFSPRLMAGALHAQTLPVMLDIHWYHFTFWAFRRVSLAWYQRVIIPWHGRLIRRLMRRRPVIIGEWSGVIASEWLQRYDQKLHVSMEYAHLRQQLAIYRHATAWCYWTYKTEAPGIWSYRSLVERDPKTFE